MNAYSNLRLIGKGSYGKVYLGDRDGKKYAVKEDMRGLSQSYLREVATLRTIGTEEKRGLISYKEFIPERGVIVLEYMKTDLMKELDSGSRLLDINSTIDILYGLLYLHSRGILHRDLKENNILCDGSNNDILYITDFGISRWLGAGGITLTPGIFPRELAPPEIIEGSNSYTYSSDIWCLGIVILELYLGYLIEFPGSMSSKDERLRFIDEFVRTPYTKGITKLETYLNDGEITQEQYNLVSSMLQFDPKKRPQANQILESLGENIIKYETGYTDSILKNLLLLDTIRSDQYYPEERLKLNTVFRKNIKPDTSHLAIRYYDITGVDINICFELAARVNEIYYKEDKAYNSSIINLVKRLDYQLYQPTIMNVYRLYSKRLFQTEILLLNKVSVSGIATKYGIERVVRSLIYEDDLISEIMIIN